VGGGREVSIRVKGDREVEKEGGKGVKVKVSNVGSDR